jgi:hypothetical protein
LGRDTTTFGVGWFIIGLISSLSRITMAVLSLATITHEIGSWAFPNAFVHLCWRIRHRQQKWDGVESDATASSSSTTGDLAILVQPYVAGTAGASVVSHALAPHEPPCRESRLPQSSQQPAAACDQHSRSSSPEMQLVDSSVAPSAAAAACTEGVAAAASADVFRCWQAEDKGLQLHVWLWVILFIAATAVLCYCISTGVNLPQHGQQVTLVDWKQLPCCCQKLAVADRRPSTMIWTFCVGCTRLLGGQSSFG